MTFATRKLLDETFPPRGPCAFCGHSQARHRVTDAIRGFVRAERRERSERAAVALVAREYPWCSEQAVRALSRLGPQAYGAWLRSGVKA